MDTPEIVVPVVPAATPAPVVPAAAAPVDVAALVSALTAKIDGLAQSNAALKTQIDTLRQEGPSALKTKYPDVSAELLADVPAEKREAVAAKMQATIDGHKPKTAQDALSAWANAGSITPANEDEARVKEVKRGERIEKAKAEGNFDALVSERKPEYAKFLSGLLRKPGR